MDWNGKRVLVTGGEGFIGSHLVERLVDEGASVRVLAPARPLGRSSWAGAHAARAPRLKRERKMRIVDDFQLGGNWLRMRPDRSFLARPT